ncbi:MAG: pentapeptide repeat-containing protein [Polyangiales bacterium]|nr:pentapeptide repeat-containing protein [Myxococcales bacterium]MCB9657283.1 pentapeptide repeat-containing protein [Sandaracinaceae bacterium]
MEALRARWSTPDGREIAGRLRRMIDERIGARAFDGCLEINGLVTGFPDPHAEHPEYADLRGFDFSGWRIDHSFWDADLSGASFDGAMLTRASIQHCGMQGTTFREAVLEQSQIFHPSPGPVDLARARLTQCDLSGDWGGANFRDAHLEDVSIDQADVARASFAGTTWRGTTRVGFRDAPLGVVHWKDREAVQNAARHARAGWFMAYADPSGASERVLQDPHVRPKPTGFRAVTLREGAFSGLLAAPPDDPRLREALGVFTYDQYVKDLAELQVRVDGAEGHFVLRDAEGRAFHPTYDRTCHFTEKRDAPWTVADEQLFLGRANRYLAAALFPAPPMAWQAREQVLRPRMLPGGLFPMIISHMPNDITFVPDRATLEQLCAARGWDPEWMLGTKEAP